MSTLDQPESWRTSGPGPVSFAQSLDLNNDDNLKELYIAMPPRQDHIPPEVLKDNIKFLRKARDEYFLTKRFFAHIRFKLELFKVEGEPLPDYGRDDQLQFLISLKQNPERWATNGVAPLLLHVALHKYMEDCRWRELIRVKDHEESNPPDSQDDLVVKRIIHELVDVEIGFEGRKEPISELQERWQTTHYREWECIAKEGAKFYDHFSNRMEILILLPGTASCHCGLCSWVLERRQGHINLSDPKLLGSLNEILLKQASVYRLVDIAKFFFKRLQLLLCGKVTPSKVLEEIQVAEEKLNGGNVFYIDMFPEG